MYVSHDSVLLGEWTKGRATMQSCSTVLIVYFPKDSVRVANFASSIARMQRKGFLNTGKVDNFPHFTQYFKLETVDCVKSLITSEASSKVKFQQFQW